MRVGVVGCGLIGGSVLRCLAEHGTDGLAAYDPSPLVRDELAALGIAEADDVEALASESELVVVAAPPAETATIVARLLAADDEVVVTDTSSIKASIAREVRAAAPQMVGRFVPGHPLAGSERTGFASARSDLFDGAVWALCPERDADLGPVGRVIGLVNALGASAYLVDADAHDIAVGFSSHAPHLIANAMARATPPELRSRVALLSGGGLRDGTRVAASDVALWREIVSANRDATLAGLSAHRNRLDEISRAVEDSDWAMFDALWAEGSAATRALLALRWAPATEESVTVAATTEALFDVCNQGCTIRSLRLAPDERIDLLVRAGPVE